MCGSYEEHFSCRVVLHKEMKEMKIKITRIIKTKAMHRDKISSKSSMQKVSKMKRENGCREARFTKVLNGNTRSISKLYCITTIVLLRGNIQVSKIISYMVWGGIVWIPSRLNEWLRSCVIGTNRVWSFKLIGVIKAILALQSNMPIFVA